MRKKKNTPIYIAAFVLFFTGFGYLFYSGIADGGIDVFSVAEARALPPEKLQSVRLFGTVADFPAPQTGNGQGVSFYLTDEGNKNLTLLVRFAGVVPDTFKSGIEVYIEGSMQPGAAQGASPHFAAGTLRTKCPSKYEKENRA